MPSASLPSHPSFRALLLVGALALGSLAVACDSDDDAEAEEPTSTATATATATTEGTTSTDAMLTSTGEAASTPTADATRASVGDADAALPAYSALVEDVTAAFPDVTLIEDVSSFGVGDGALTGEGRRVLVFGTAADLPSYTEIAQELRTILEADGWTEVTSFAADGPTATLSVWEKGEDLAVLAAGVSPQDPSACPADQLIAECLDELEPSAIDVQGSITVANR